MVMRWGKKENGSKPQYNFKMKTLKLSLLTILKYSFFFICYPITWLLLIIDVIVHLLSFRYVELNMTERFTQFVLWIGKKILKKEFSILFGK